MGLEGLQWKYMSSITHFLYERIPTVSKSARALYQYEAGTIPSMFLSITREFLEVEQPQMADFYF